MVDTAMIVIPARMASTRFPNKPMALIRGMAMIERVWRLGKAVRGAHEVVIATDDERLKDYAESFGAKVLLTSSSCATGTDRVAEVSHREDVEHSLFFSLQGDAVLTPPWVIEEVLSTMLAHRSIQMATPAVKLTGEALEEFIALKQRGSSTGTSVVFNQQGDALYFSKALIPFSRESDLSKRVIYRHIGLYAYRKEMLQRLSSLPEGELEKMEKLEQLRALENGIPIRIVPVDYRGRMHGSVDLPEDIATVERAIERDGELV